MTSALTSSNVFKTAPNLNPRGGAFDLCAFFWVGSSNIWPSERLEVALYTTPLFIQPPAGPHRLVSAHQRVQYTPTDTRTRTERVYSAALKSYLPFFLCVPLAWSSILRLASYSVSSKSHRELQSSAVCVCVCVRNIGEGGVGRVDTIPTQSQREIPPKVFVAGWWEERRDFLKLRAGARANGFSPVVDAI